MESVIGNVKIKFCHQISKHQNKHYLLWGSLLKEKKQQGYHGFVKSRRSFSKDPWKRSVSFTPGQLANPIQFMVSWTLGTSLRKEKRCKVSRLLSAYISHRIEVLPIITAHLSDQCQDIFSSTTMQLERT